MREAVIVSTARSPIGKAYRGAFNAIQGPVLAAGLPDSVAAATIDRQCASGLNAVAIAAYQVLHDGVNVALAGGLDSISLVQTEDWNGAHYRIGAVPERYYMPMLETAELVAARYGISRAAQDTYALESQRRTAQAQADGLFADEIVAVSTMKTVFDKAGGDARQEAVTLAIDECNRPGTTLAGLQGLVPVLGAGHSVTAGNASQLSDGASACVVMEAGEAARRGLTPLGSFRGMAVAGCAPEEMGIGPVLAIPRLLQRHGLTIADIDLWEINEAFAAQLLYCRDHLGIDAQKLNVNGGAISIGHPYGMSGARMVGHALLEGRRRRAKLAVVSMCIGGGQGAAGLFEILG